MIFTKFLKHFYYRRPPDYCFCSVFILSTRMQRRASLQKLTSRCGQRLSAVRRRIKLGVEIILLQLFLEAGFCLVLGNTNCLFFWLFMKKSCLHLDQLLTAKFLKQILQTNGQEKSTPVFTQNIKVKFVFS